MGSSKKAIFFVSKPLELLGAIEARKQFEIDYSIIVYSCKPGLDKNTIEFLIEKSSNWNEVLFVKHKPYYGLFWVKLINNLKKEKYQFLFTRAFPISAYFVHNLNYEKHLLLDDGMATINIAKEFNTNKNLTKRFSLFKGLNKDGFKYIFISWLYKLMKINVDGAITSVNFFTFYNVPEKNMLKVYKNEMSWFKSLMKQSNFVKTTNTIFVIGSYVCNATIMSSDDYFNTLNKIKNYYKGKNLTYIPHPHENEEFLDALKDIGITIKKNKYNIELDFILAKQIPNHVVGTISTALITLKLIFGDETKVEYFEFDNKIINKAYKTPLKKIYSYQDRYLGKINMEN